MAELVKVYGQNIPAMRFIGRKYGEKDVMRGGYGHIWGEWFGKGLFVPLEKLYEAQRAGIQDDDAYIGLMRHKPGEPFEYWIGMLFAADAHVPDGYDYVDFDESRLGVAWLKGVEAEIYAAEDVAVNGLDEAGYHPAADRNGACWYMERYACPRFTSPDEQGDVTLDICVFAGR